MSGTKPSLQALDPKTMNRTYIAYDNMSSPDNNFMEFNNLLIVYSSS